MKSQVDSEFYRGSEINPEIRATVPFIPSRPKTCCVGCGTGMTWAEIRRQYGRLLRKGLTVEQVKAILPKCQKCVAQLLSGGVE
ncbi:MAG TPA: hypothetical protein VGM98_15735 [Schlesneria sp.]|jgi:hypothetical protein